MGSKANRWLAVGVAVVTIAAGGVMSFLAAVLEPGGRYFDALAAIATLAAALFTFVTAAGAVVYVSQNDRMWK